MFRIPKLGMFRFLNSGKYVSIVWNKGKICKFTRTNFESFKYQAPTIRNTPSIECTKNRSCAAVEFVYKHCC